MHTLTLSHSPILTPSHSHTLTLPHPHILTPSHPHRYWKLGQKTEDGMPTYPVEYLSTEEVLGTSVYRWKLHSNWVTEVGQFMDEPIG